MSQLTINRRIVLNSRPHGAPTPQNFRLEEAAIPKLHAGQVLLRTLYLSLDPYMRGRMGEGPSYAPPTQLGEVMVGGTVSRVVASEHSEFRRGDLVLGAAGWQDYEISDGTGLMLIDGTTPPSYALSVLGMPGFTAWHGLLKIGEPQRGETVVVASASGAVGAVVGQIAKLKGARVVGIVGGADKARYVVDELGFDVGLDHRDSHFAAKLQAAVPHGIDVYFENVGGKVFDAVLPLLNDGARVPVCGLIAQYNASEPPPGPNVLPHVMWNVLYKRIRMQGFIILDHYAEFAQFRRDMTEWLAAGKVKLREDLVEGLENAPTALIGLLEGKNFGKVVVKVAE